MKITSYEELNKLVAQTLGWEETEIDVQVIVDKTVKLQRVNVLHPKLGVGERPLDYWREYDTCPDFSTDWQLVEKFILAECDRQKLAVQIVRTSLMISCSIKPMNYIEDDRPARSFITGEMGVPKSTPLAVCLAWLRFNNVEFEFEPETNKP